MNRKMIFYMVGQIVRLEGVLFLLPIAVSLIYRETSFVYFLITAAGAVVIGTALTLLCKSKSSVIFAKEGFVIVAIAWLFMSLIGAFPFYISREIPSYTDAFFETVSGFTTTGASILTDIGSLDHGMLFWRSFTHWIGGMGVLVFITAIIPSVSDRSIHMLRAEMPGPIVGKLVPRAKKTAKILYLIYIAITAAEIIFLLCGGLSLFESAIYAFGTAGTGGFGIKADSVAGYSPYVQWVVTVFMLLFGINFNLYYLILIRRFRSVIKSSELWTYIGLCAAAVVVIALDVRPLYGSLAESFRHSAFQTSSIITTTGFSTTDFNVWPDLSKGILLTLMFIGGCAGSTAGGLKVSRIILLFKNIGSELLNMLHPRSVSSVRFEGKKIEEKTLHGVSVYFTLYAVVFFIIFIAICHEPFGFETNFSAVAACFNNVGPGFGLVGPAGSYACYSAVSKIFLSVAMLLGRLEIYPIIFMLSPSIWTKK